MAQTRNPEVINFELPGFALRAPRKTEEEIRCIPGELSQGRRGIELNAGRKTVTVSVANSGDRPIQVGSHYHFSKPIRR